MSRPLTNTLITGQRPYFSKKDRFPAFAQEANYAAFTASFQASASQSFQFFAKVIARFEPFQSQSFEYSMSAILFVFNMFQFKSIVP